MLPFLRLRRLGILGMNQRNAQFILPHNPRRFYPLVDDKRRTKELMIRAGIAVPELYGVVEIERQLRNLDRHIGPHLDFVVKPAHGSGGNGILVIVDRRNERFRKSNGLMLTRDEIEHHISNILSGMHSLGGVPDCALIEYRVKFDPLFEPVSYQGVPDIRTIVFRGIPVMSMVRLPTRLSDGKANLHQGALGVGIDLCSGRTTAGVWLTREVDQHPDTGAPVRDFVIPRWTDLLVLTARCHELTGLGYIGVDIVLDRDRGPLVLELNARPGLSIQLANKCGLLGRLEQIRCMPEVPTIAEERVQLARKLFAAAS